MTDIISVNFTQCMPQTGDWVGIYPSNANPQYLDKTYLEWSWACPTNGCQGDVYRSTIQFKADIPYGMYKAFLVRASRNGVPYPSAAISQMFTVAYTCP